MKKKVLVIVLSVVLVMVTPIVLVYINQQQDFSDDAVHSDVDNTNDEYYDDYEQHTDEITEEIRLSDGCDKTLATGKNKNGDFYELVANQKETYDSVKIEIGVIENNEWLLQPTSDMPFIDKETGLLNVGQDNIGLDDIKIDTSHMEHIEGTFEYIADSCFCIYNTILKNMEWHGSSYCSIIYNAKNNKTFYNNGDVSGSLFTYLPYDYNYGNQLLLQDRYSIGGLPFEEYRSDFFILNTDTMKVSKIVERTKYNIVGPVGDNLFAVGDSEYNNYAGNPIMYFYDIEGNKVIDLTSYNDGEVYDANKNYFEDGKFTFIVENEAGTKFNVTIDTKGNVIDSVEA